MKDKYYGSDITRDDSWLLELSKIPEDMRNNEAELMQTRWFDYRDLLPAQATYLFADLFVEESRSAYAKTRDYRIAGSFNPLLDADVFDSPDCLPMWRARQAADMIGCKYDFYLRFVMGRFLERGWSYLPRPNQISSEELTLDINDSWNELLQCSLQLATKGRFQDGQYEGHPDQDAYHSFLVEQVKKREHKHMIISRLVFKERVLPQMVAERHFGIDLINRAKDLIAA